MIILQMLEAGNLLKSQPKPTSSLCFVLIYVLRFSTPTSWSNIRLSRHSWSTGPWPAMIGLIGWWSLRTRKYFNNFFRWVLCLLHASSIWSTLHQIIIIICLIMCMDCGAKSSSSMVIYDLYDQMDCLANHHHHPYMIMWVDRILWLITASTRSWHTHTVQSFP